jgi:hypothetical protein
MANPFRDRLLAAARRRLTEASPDFDESSVADGLEMLRDAEGDEAAVEAIWQALKELPETYQREIQRRRSAA